MKAAEFAKQWNDGNIVGCKQSMAAAYRYLKLDLDIETHNQLIGLIEWVNFHDRGDVSVKNWKLK